MPWEVMIRILLLHSRRNKRSLIFVLVRVQVIIKGDNEIQIGLNIKKDIRPSFNYRLLES